MSHTNSARRAFTLIEFLIVLSIMLIVAGFLLPMVASLLKPRSPAASQTTDTGVYRYVVVVLDASGSMDETMDGNSGKIVKMDAAKNALLKAFTTVPEHTHIGILVFSATNLAYDWVYPLGPYRRGDVVAAVLKPEPGGGTPLGEYIEKAAASLLLKKSTNATLQMVVVTDGEANNKPLMEQAANDALAAGIKIDVVGVAMEKDNALATRVSSYCTANDAQALEKVLGELLAEAPESESVQEAPAPPTTPEPEPVQEAPAPAP